jgi:hypothetical protein
MYVNGSHRIRCWQAAHRATWSEMDLMLMAFQ